ncbi:hypothetical protein [Cognatiluteimonas profundi]|nr:hypothetical protein [Lysobacter profundi]
MSAITPMSCIGHPVVGGPVTASLAICIGARRRVGMTTPAQSLRGVV